MATQQINLTEEDLKELEVKDEGKDKEPKEGEKPLRTYGRFTEKAHLDFEPLQFKNFNKMWRTTNKELCAAINAKFRNTFRDFRTCMIRFYNGKFYVEFYFQPNAESVEDDKRLKNVVTVGKENIKNEKSFLPGMAAIQQKSTGQMLTLNDETKLMLAPLMCGGKDHNMPENKKVWNNNIIPCDFTQQQFNPNPFLRMNSHQFFLRVVNIDIHYLLRELFGRALVAETVPDGKGGNKNITADAYYEARFIRALAEPEVFLMNVEQFDVETVKELLLKSNPQIAYASGLPPFFFN